MKKTAPCYSKIDYYDFFDIDFSNQKILDIGSSIGSFKKSRSFTSSTESLSSAKQYITMDIDPESGADIIGDAHKLPFKNNEFNIIIANNVIEHFYSPSIAITEMKRVLKPGGKLYFTIPFMYPIHEAPYDFSRLTRYGLEHLFHNFTTSTIHARGGAFSTIAHIIYKMTHVLDKLYLGNFIRALLYPFLWIWVQLDRFDNSEAFTRVYFGLVVK